MPYLFLLIFLLLSEGAFAQKFRVYFKDKGPQSETCTPYALGEQALARRAAAGIPLQRDDLPVAPAYRAALQKAGFKILMHSRWFNYALVEGPAAEDLQQWAFVRRVEPAPRYRVHWASAQNFNYGSGRNQIDLLQGQDLHRRGFTGRGQRIAVLDGGFTGVLTPAFDSLWLGGQIIATYNFVTRDSNVVQRGSHGASVLSVMGANLPGSLVGTAPHAEYLLLTSEDELSETPVELDYWVAAAEFADSAGATVINSSLGYTTFDDPSDDFSYADMDGRSNVASLAASRAASKGIVVVVAAGNSGAGAWRHIGAPADADSILAVGGVDGNGLYAAFSSHGPSADGRVKPELAAVAAGTALVARDGNVRGGFGTSFAAPAVAGLMACLRQAQPQLSVMDLRDQVLRSAHQYTHPDSLLGYGIPNFDLAFYLGQEDFSVLETADWQIFPNPLRDELQLQVPAHFKPAPLRLQIRDQRGRLVLERQAELEPGGLWRLPLGLSAGLYFLRLSTASAQWQLKVIVSP